MTEDEIAIHKAEREYEKLGMETTRVQYDSCMEDGVESKQIVAIRTDWQPSEGT